MVAATYDPFWSPLDMPVRTVEIACRAERPFRLDVRDGATPGTLLNGLFKKILLATACRRSRLAGRDETALIRAIRTQQVVSACLLDKRNKGVCLSSREGRTADCACGVLLNGVLGRDPGRERGPMVLLDAPELWSGEEQADFTLHAKLFGRRAAGLGELVWAAVRAMGEVGLLVQGEPVRFQPASPVATLAGSVLDLARRSPPASPALLLEFPRAVALRETVRAADGRLERLFQAGGAFDLARALREFAFVLCDQDMDDRDEAEAPPLAERQALAEECRRLVERKAARLTVTRAVLEPVDLGTRPSGAGRGAMEFKGFRGYAVVEGDMTNIYPYLLAFALRGGGQMKSKGLGQIVLWNTVG